jgi:parallel beta-helix repeat protein
MSGTLLIWSCDSAVDSAGTLDESLAVKSKANNNAVANSLATCQSAGDTGLTAVYVNESVSGATINFSNYSCDIAIYFDENAPKNATVRGVTIIQTTAGGGTSTGIWNEGADVTVTRLTFTTDYSGQHVPIRFDEGASGMITHNELSGTHRTAILLRGDGTNVQVKGNVITGSGAKTSGWAENGIQVDQGATGDITGNKITGHWWDGESNFASTGLMLFGSNAKATNNTFHNNEFSIYLSGENNKVTGNDTSSDIVSQSSLNFKAYGALVGNTENHLAGNNFRAKEGTGAVGIYIFANDSKVTGNRISGFTNPVYDLGSDNMIKGTPAPPAGI